MRAHRDLQLMASFVHGVLFMGHTIGVVYHASRKRWGHALFHFGAAVYDGYSALRHDNARRQHGQENR